MTDLMELMAAPFAACVVLVGIHAYLGLHVIQRKVIFVDLALAQIAALGATFGFLLGVSPHGQAAYVFSLGFAIIGAAIFALTRMRHERIPQEAIIGIVYAVALAGAILVADRAPEGSEHIKETLTGALLWVRWSTIVKTGVIYALVGLLHLLLRKRFFQISFAPDEAYAEGRSVRLWDFIFYVTFAFVITSSVAIAGVLLVFSFLVIPAVIATLFAHKISTRLILGWTVGLAACAIGLVASYRLDLPAGPSVVTSLGATLVLAGLIYSVWHAERRWGAAVKVSAGLGAVLIAFAAVGLFATSGAFLHVEHEHDWEEAAANGSRILAADADFLQTIFTGCEGDDGCAAEKLANEPAWPEEVRQRVVEAEPAEREGWIRVLGEISGEEADELLAEFARAETDPLLSLQAVETLIGRGDRLGFELALGLLEGETMPPLVRDEAHGFLSAAADEDFGYDALGGGTDNAAAILRIRGWLEEIP